MSKNILQRASKYARHFTEITGVDSCVISVADRNFFERPPVFCQDHCVNRKCDCDCLNVCLRGVFEARKWDGRYTFYCPIGFVFVATYKSTDVGNRFGIVAGPFSINEVDTMSLSAVDEEYNEHVRELPIVSSSKAFHCGEALAALTTCCGDRDQGYSPTENQWDLVNRMFDYVVTEKNTDLTSYPVEVERRICQLIRDGNADMVLQQVNILLSYLTYAVDDLTRSKSRCIEIIVLMSRAAIEAGQDANAILTLTPKLIFSVNACATFQDMAYWTSCAAQTFVTLTQRDSKHSYAISQAIRYIDQHYNKKITLEQVAHSIHMSNSYFSKIFAEETGTTFSKYVNKVRIEKSKNIILDQSLKLVDVAYLVGFGDQSHFSKSFRKVVGVTPGKYISLNGNIVPLKFNETGYKVNPGSMGAQESS